MNAQAAADRALTLDETDWFLDPAKIADVIDVLIGEGYLTTPEEVVYVVRKPWKYTYVYRAVKAAQR